MSEALEAKNPNAVSLARNPLLYLALSLVGGLILRVWGLTWGLPTGLHPDEYVVVNGALDLLNRNSWIPIYYFRPDHVEIYLSRMLYDAYAHLVFGTGPLVNADAHGGLFILLSRSVTVVFGVATIWFGYLIGKRFGSLASILLPALIAFNPLLIENSHFATPDVPLTAMTTLAIYFGLRYLESPQILWLVLGGGASAVATGIKYPGIMANGVAAAVTIYVAVKSKRWGRASWHAAAAFASFLAGMLIAAPAIFINYSEALKNLLGQGGVSNDSGSGLGFWDTLGFYFSNFAASTGSIITALALIGIWFAVRTKSPARIPIIFTILYMVILSVIPLHWVRWELPLIPGMLLAATIAVSEFSKRILANGRHLFRGSLPRQVLTLLAVVNVLLVAITNDAILTAPDTRLTSDAKVSAAGANAGNTIFEGYSTFDPKEPGTVFDAFNNFATKPVAKDSSKKFLLLSGCVDGTYLGSDRFPQQAAFYTAIAKNYKLALDYAKTVRTPVDNWFEPVNIFGQIQGLLSVPNGVAGCDLKLYALNS